MSEHEQAQEQATDNLMKQLREAVEEPSEYPQWYRSYDATAIDEHVSFDARLAAEVRTQRARAEQAERRLAIALGADKPDKPATAAQRARYWAMEAAAQKERAEDAESKLAALPYKAIYDCWYHSDGQTPDDSADAVEAWLNGAKPLIDILASLYRIADAVLMHGEPLKHDLEVAQAWMEKYPRR